MKAEGHNPGRGFSGGWRAPRFRRLAVPLCLGVGLALLPGSLPGQEASPGESPREQGDPGVLEVHVVDRDTGSPLRGATVRIRQRDRLAVTDADGRASLTGLPPRPYVIVVSRLGYMSEEVEVEVGPGEHVRIEVGLVASPIHLAGVVVTGTGRERGLREVYQPTTSLTGIELHRSLGSSVPATLRNVPGFHLEYNGPGAARPVIRGMGGDRVLMLEDGHRTGDLYQTASDHGVMVEPLSVDRMEVVRGPAGLLYGPNALGGVVNVIRNDVPRSRPTSLTGTFSSQFESVNSGGAGSMVLSGPLGPLAYRVEGTGRSAGDSRTPLGTLPKTGISGWNAAGGLSWVTDWGFVGVAGRRFENTYGVPGEFQGELIPGGHPGGVDAETTRTSGRIRALYDRPFLGFFDSVELDGHVTQYIHDEIEGIVGGERVLGARFHQTTTGVNITAHHDHRLHDHPGEEARAEGAWGLAFEHRDLWAGGSQPGTRSAEEWTASVFGYEEFSWNGLRFQIGGRVDRRSVTPASLDSIIVRTEERRVSKPVAPRSFTSISASAAVLRDLSETWTVGANLARSIRTPSVEELYSDGPHLADFSFDIGTPDLDPERGLGLDVFLRGTRRDLSLEVAAFYNRVQNFIYYAQTGETVRIFREGVPPRITPVFEAQGDDAAFMGFEGRIQWEVLRNVVLDGTASYTRASLLEDSEPLPFIPPLSGRGEVRYEGEVFFASLGSNWALRQHRVPAPVEFGDGVERPQEPTDGYALLNAGVGFRFRAAGLTHTASLEGENLTNREWRDHLSRIKDIAPQPGRNVQLTYRVHF